MTKAKSAVQAQQPAVQAPVVEKETKAMDMSFIDFRNGNEYCLEVTSPCEIVLTQMNKFSETKGLDPLGSWVKASVRKILSKNADGSNNTVEVKAFLLSKNKKGYMYAGKLPLEAAKENNKEVAQQYNDE